MSDVVLITGGAGFVGSHLADSLLKRKGFRTLDPPGVAIIEVPLR